MVRGGKTSYYHKNGMVMRFLKIGYLSKKCIWCPPRFKLVIDEKSDKGVFKVAS